MEGRLDHALPVAWQRAGAAACWAGGWLGGGGGSDVDGGSSNERGGRVQRAGKERGGGVKGATARSPVTCCKGEEGGTRNGTVRNRAQENRLSVYRTNNGWNQLSDPPCNPHLRVAPQLK